MHAHAFLRQMVKIYYCFPPRIALSNISHRPLETFGHLEYSAPSTFLALTSYRFCEIEIIVVIEKEFKKICIKMLYYKVSFR